MSGETIKGLGLVQKIPAKDRKLWLVVAAGVLGMLLILLSSFGDRKSASSAEDGANAGQEYVAETEKKLTQLLSQVEGVGKIKVMVTLETGVEYVYAKDEKLSTDRESNYGESAPQKVTEKDTSEQKYIMVDGQGGKRQALMLTQMEPKIKGVVVVCEGANNPVIKERVTTAVTTALGVSSLKVCVIKLA